MKARIPGSERTELSASDPGREPILAVEYVRTVLFDVGRSIDLRLAAAALPGSSDFKPVKRRNTPASLTLPRTLSVPLAPGLRGKDPQTSMEGAEASAKLYEEGVISLTVRARLAARLSELHSLGSRLFPLGNNSPATVDGYIEDRFRDLQESLGLAITPEVPGAPPEREHYTAYCISDWGSGSPDDFVARNRKVLASLLEGEPAARDLHETQIAKSLGNSFSYGAEDLAVFDLEHCVIMDRSGDWEDLLLIAEHANYQLLELRVLDRLLDQWLDEAEKDLRDMYAGGRHSRRVRNRGLPARFARLQNLRLEALFILENLENSAKIIGDYFLGQIYVHLGLVFSVEGWTRSVERHLGALQSIYEIVKSDKSERTMVFLEIVFIVVCIAFPVLQILQVMLSG